MSSQRHERLGRIFLDASKLPESQRSAYIDAQCGDDVDLRAEVVAMLRHNDEPCDDVLDSGGGAEALANAIARSDPPAVDDLGRGMSVGPYTIVERLGEGGFATVYLADQATPVRRRVALKVLKPGMDSRQILARFDAERDALARMNHEHVARIIDAGATDNGRPYFVMEHVDGEHITTFCRRRGLSIVERLQLFKQACAAVEHAHQKGIIHRDIKPSNVLVFDGDTGPVLKVIDFGIAKAITTPLTADTMFTERGQLIGTPEYMSPEQADPGARDIDTRTDVYSLGVLLYELLVGAPPFDLREAAFFEICHTIREVEPPKPSTRVSAVGDGRTTTAPTAEARALARALRGDLDWVVLRALEKDRNRRYQSASGLAADIQKYLDHEPVTASPPSASYRLRKFVRRNRAGVTTVGLVAIVLIFGVVGTTWGMLLALDEKNRADGEAARATLAAQDEVRERTRAEAITEFVIAALQSSDAMSAGGRQDMTILAAMGNAIRHIESGRFADDPKMEADLKNTIAMILLNNARAGEAEPLFAGALATRRQLFNGDHPDIATSLNNLGLVRGSLGREAEAESLHLEALEMRRRLFDGDHRSIAISIHNLAIVRSALRGSAAAEPLYMEALQMRRRLLQGDHEELAHSLDGIALVWDRLGRASEAEPLFVEALEMRRRLHPGDHPDIARSMNNLAMVMRSQGRHVKAEPLLIESLEMRRRLYSGDHPTVSMALNNLASVRGALGRKAEAETLFVESLEMDQRLHGGDHPSIASGLMNLASVRQDQGRLEEAESGYLLGLAMDRRLYPGDHSNVAHDLHNLASLRMDLGRTVEGEQMYIEALAMRQRLYKGDHPQLANTMSSLATVRQNLGRTVEAREGYDAAIAMLRRLAPSGVSFQPHILWRSGLARLDEGNREAGLAELEEAVLLAERILPSNHPALDKYRASLKKALASPAEAAVE